MFLGFTNIKISNIYSLIKTSPFFGEKFTPFDKREDTGEEGIILGENPAGHCFVLRELIPINIFK